MKTRWTSSSHCYLPTSSGKPPFLSPFLAWQKYLPLFRRAWAHCCASFPLLQHELKAIYSLVAEVGWGECKMNSAIKEAINISRQVFIVLYIKWMACWRSRFNCFSIVTWKGNFSRICLKTCFCFPACYNLVLFDLQIKPHLCVQQPYYLS